MTIRHILLVAMLLTLVGCMTDNNQTEHAPTKSEPAVDQPVSETDEASEPVEYETIRPSEDMKVDDCKVKAITHFMRGFYTEGLETRDATLEGRMEVTFDHDGDCYKVTLWYSPYNGEDLLTFDQIHSCERTTGSKLDNDAAKVSVSMFEGTGFVQSGMLDLSPGPSLVERFISGEQGLNEPFNAPRVDFYQGKLLEFVDTMMRRIPLTCKTE